MTEGHAAILNPREAANYLGLSTSWLAKLRLTGDGPPFLKLGRQVRYRRADLDAWLNQRLRRSTSDPGYDPDGSNGAGGSTAWSSAQGGRS
jgi:excisionase family DNA binding protein